MPIMGIALLLLLLVTLCTGRLRNIFALNVSTIQCVGRQTLVILKNAILETGRGSLWVCEMYRQSAHKWRQGC
jgi:hypothetical protein